MNWFPPQTKIYSRLFGGQFLHGHHTIFVCSFLSGKRKQANSRPNHPTVEGIFAPQKTPPGGTGDIPGDMPGDIPGDVTREKICWPPGCAKPVTRPPAMAEGRIATSNSIRWDECVWDINLSINMYNNSIFIILYIINLYTYEITHYNLITCTIYKCVDTRKKPLKMRDVGNTRIFKAPNLCTNICLAATKNIYSVPNTVSMSQNFGDGLQQSICFSCSCNCLQRPERTRRIGVIPRVSTHLQ